MVGKPITILIVEDHQATLDGLAIGLSREEDFQIVGTSLQSDEGLELARQLKPDVILLDLHLPGSINSPKTMISQYLQAGSRLVIFSAESRMAFIQAVLSLGVAAYLLKSERISRVSEVIREVMSGKGPVVSEQARGNHKKITRAEAEVLSMLAKGMKYQDIADARITSATTARKQCETLQLKLGLDTREQLIAWAVENGFGSIDSDIKVDGAKSG